MRGLLAYIFRVISSLALSLALTLSLFHLTIGNQSRVEKWIGSATSSDAIQEYLVANSGTKGVAKVALQQALNPKLVQDNLGGLVHTAFDWLNGKNKEPYYAIDISEFNKNYQDTLYGSLESKILSLPQCPAAQLPEEVDQSYLEGLACNPFGPAAQVTNMFADARQGAQSNKIEIKSGPGSIFEKFAQVPGYFQLSKKLIPVAWLAFIVSSALAFASEKHKRNYLRDMAAKLSFAGASLLFSAGLLKLQASGKLSTGLSGADKLMSVLTKSASSDLILIFGLFGFGLFAVGASIGLGVKLSRPRITPNTLTTNPKGKM